MDAKLIARRFMQDANFIRQVMLHDTATAEKVAREISLVMSFKHANIVQVSRQL